MTAKNISTQASWSNREEEWYVTNKVLLFATQSEDASNIWVTKLNDLLYNYETPRKHDAFFPEHLNLIERLPHNYEHVDEQAYYGANLIPSATSELVAGITP